MPVPVVTVVAGTENPIGEGLTRPVRCLVRFQDGVVRAAVVKRIPPHAVSAEVFGALLLRGWGLHVPEPAIVKETAIAFASLDVGYPNLKQRIGWSDALPPLVKQVMQRSGEKLVAGLTDTPRALAADEAIDNRDRNLGNILWDGKNAAWIDHERAFGLVSDKDINKLALMVLAAGDHRGVEAAAVSIALALAPPVVEEARNGCGDLSVDGLASIVSSRLASLASKVLLRFPQPKDLLASLADPPSGPVA